MKRMRSVLITGCSSGVGRAAALHFAELGYRVYAGVRMQSDAHELLVASEYGTIVPVILDVLVPSQRAEVANQLNSELADTGLDVLINNAGVAKFSPLEFTSEADLRRVFDVNTMGPILLTQALMPLLRQAKGRIVLVGSIGGRISFSFNGPYSISKFALAAYAETLRRELEGSGIHVSLLEPGSIATPMIDKVELETETAIGELPQQGRLIYEQRLRQYLATLPISKKYATTPDQIAVFMARVATARNPKSRYAVTPDARSLFFLQWILPVSWFDWIIRKSMELSRLAK